MTQFSTLGLAEPLLRAVTAEGYTLPTPIQKAVIPVMLKGQDLVGIAQTGTGKTAAFVLPLLNALTADPTPSEPKTCKALILAPTRELASQIGESIRTYGKFMRVSVAVIVGGVKPGPQVKMLAPGVDIVVATPGRLLDHMNLGIIRLNRTAVVVLDEADQMLDLGFMPAIRRIMAKVALKRQTALLSATMPKEIRSLANDFLKNPVEIAVTPVSRPIDRIEQRVLLVHTSAKREVLIEQLEAKGVERAIVFTRTKRGADKVCQSLQQAGINAVAIHGNKSQSQRERALDGFRSHHTKVLVATDIAARGIDIDGITHVVNFELPNVPESYVHRIGRTARAGASGVAISLVDGAEAGLLRDIEKLIGRSLNAVIDTGQGTRPAMPNPGSRPAQPQGQRPAQPQGQRPGRSAPPTNGAQPAAAKRRRRRRPAGAPGAANREGGAPQQGRRDQGRVNRPS